MAGGGFWGFFWSYLFICLFLKYWYLGPTPESWGVWLKNCFLLSLLHETHIVPHQLSNYIDGKNQSIEGEWVKMQIPDILVKISRNIALVSHSLICSHRLHITIKFIWGLKIQQFTCTGHFQALHSHVADFRILRSSQRVLLNSCVLDC